MTTKITKHHNKPDKSFEEWKVGTCIGMPFASFIYNNVKLFLVYQHHIYKCELTSRKGNDTHKILQKLTTRVKAE